MTTTSALIITGPPLGSQHQRGVERPHGTRKRYVFGPSGNDRGNACRCTACTQANRRYVSWDTKRRRLGRSEGAWATPHVATTRARAHIDQLRSSGIGARQIARLAGISRTQVTDITAGRSQHIRRATEAAILAVQAQAAPGALVDARPTWILIERLLAAGLTRKRVAQAVTGRDTTTSLQLGRARITARAASRVEDLHR
ncbi:MAG: hypothetical protein ACRDY2_08575, partial [Acidimicrobiales bacterium]